MNDNIHDKITVETVINAPIEKVWTYWTDPEHVMQWAFASDDWHVPHAENDLRVGEQFTTRMEAKDGSTGFDFQGVYTEIEHLKKIAYRMDDGREVMVEFIPQEDGIKIVQTFDPEHENPREMQRDGWQAILENFRKHVEENQ